MNTQIASSSNRAQRKEKINLALAALPQGLEASVDHFTLCTYSQDLWPRYLLKLRQEGPPKEPQIDLVLWPENAEHLQAIVRWASVSDVILVPYGAGSGVCGATIPPSGEMRPRVMVDLKKMRAVRSIDRKSMTVWAEAGLIGENLERHLNQEGYTLGHFPSSIYCSSLGGYLATRSAGQLSTKYGKIEDMVLALEVVLPSGDIIVTGRAPRSAVGPDWTQLLLGSEGTLGFFTAACLQIHLLPRSRVFMGFGASDVYKAMHFARRLLQEGVRPAVLRIYDPLETSMAVSSEPLKKAGFSGGAALVVVFEEAREALALVQAEEARVIARELEMQDLGPEFGEHWWAHRYDVSYKQQLIMSHDNMILDTFELAATWDKLEDVYRAVKGVNAGLAHGALMVMAHLSHFYHTGANIYFTIVAHKGFATSSVERYDEIWESMLSAAFHAGATLSHHHGVGLQKNEWMRKEKTQFIAIFEKVKRGFDPENRFNPGKMGL